MKLTHPERVVDTVSGATKGDVAAYYEAVAPLLLAELKGRPVALLRAPEGVGEPGFFQKHAGRSAFPGIRLLDPALWPGHEPLLSIGGRTALMSAVQMNTLEFHAWNARSRTLDKPDRLVFDLDPGEGVAWAEVQSGAERVRDFLQTLALRSWLKTSGGRGLHVVVPLTARWPTEIVRRFSEAVVQRLAAAHPQRFVARSGAAHRVGRIFIDWLRNGEGATAVAAYSLRARPGLGVAMPIHWSELADVEGAAQWTIANAADHIARRKSDPWAELGATRQSLATPLRALALLL
ncbi:MAG TPA: non-homologous end-joining DNA ligase [Roseateles sp.]